MAKPAALALGAALALALLAGTAVAAGNYNVKNKTILFKSVEPGDYYRQSYLNKGDVCEKIDVEGDFYKVQCRGANGYIAKEMLDVPLEEGGEEDVPNIVQLLSQQPKAEEQLPKLPPAKYYFEQILSILRANNHPLFALLLALTAAVLAAALGAGATFAVANKLETVLPLELVGFRRKTAKVAVIGAVAYLGLEALVYFLDLSAHLASFNKSYALLMLISILRMLLAAPLAIIDALGGNWVVGLIAAMAIALICWPGLTPPAVANIAFDQTVPATGTLFDSAPESQPTRPLAVGGGKLEPDPPGEDSGTRIIAGDEGEK